MLSKRYELTDFDRRTWLHVPSGIRWSTSSDTRRDIQYPRPGKPRHGLQILDTRMGFYRLPSMWW